nr:reticulon-like protein B16 isoform X1 [Ziziphus jujuba var. spinosa]
MEILQDVNSIDGEGDGRKAMASTSSTPSSTSGYRLFGREASVHHCMGGGKAADVLLWKQQHVSFGVIVAATVAWILFEWSGLSFLSICSDVLLILIVVLFLCANYAAYRNKQPLNLPELVLSEEMVNDAAASFRVKINNVLLIAHDITLGKDFILFFKVVLSLWLLSVIGSFISFFTIAYVGTIILITLPALYSKYDEHVDKYCGMLHHRFSKHYKVVDENVPSRLFRSLSKDKDS